MFPLSDTRTTNRTPLFTIVLILVNIAVFFLESTNPDIESFLFTYGLVPARVNFNDIATWSPFITSMFLHGGWFHLLSNMWFLWIFGDNVEERLGIFYVPFYLAGGIVAGLIQYLVDLGSSLPMVGASGAIAAVLGAYFSLFPKHQINTLIPALGLPVIVKIPATFMLVYWFVTQLFSGFASFASSQVGGIAWFAHIGGFIAGMLLIQPFRTQSTEILENT